MSFRLKSSIETRSRSASTWRLCLIPHKLHERCQLSSFTQDAFNLASQNSVLGIQYFARESSPSIFFLLFSKQSPTVHEGYCKHTDLFLMELHRESDRLASSHADWALVDFPCSLLHEILLSQLAIAWGPSSPPCLNSTLC